MKFSKTQHFHINIQQTLYILEDMILEDPSIIDLTSEEMDVLRKDAVFWGRFWRALLGHAQDVYAADIEEGNPDFLFETEIDLEDCKETLTPLWERNL